MKFVALIDLTKKKPEERIITFMHDEPGPLPPVANPPEPDKPKDMPPVIRPRRPKEPKDRPRDRGEKKE